MTNVAKRPTDVTDVDALRLQLHPEVFGVAFPAEREPRPEWIPDDEFCYVIDSEEEFSVLCPQRRISRSVRQIQGLRVLVLYPNGFRMMDVILGIRDELRAREIPHSGASHFATGVGSLAVRDEDLPDVLSLVRAAGHTLVEPPI